MTKALKWLGANWPLGLALVVSVFTWRSAPRAYAIAWIMFTFNLLLGSVLHLQRQLKALESPFLYLLLIEAETTGERYVTSKRQAWLRHIPVFVVLSLVTAWLVTIAIRV